MATESLHEQRNTENNNKNTETRFSTIKPKTELENMHFQYLWMNYYQVSYTFCIFCDYTNLWKQNFRSGFSNSLFLITLPFWLDEQKKIMQKQWKFVGMNKEHCEFVIAVRYVKREKWLRMTWEKNSKFSIAYAITRIQMLENKTKMQNIPEMQHAR